MSNGHVSGGSVCYCKRVGLSSGSSIRCVGGFDLLSASGNKAVRDGFGCRRNCTLVRKVTGACPAFSVIR